MFSPIQRLFKRYLRTGPVQAAGSLAQMSVRRAADARWLCRQLRDAADFRPSDQGDFRAIVSPLQVLVCMFCKPATTKAAKVFVCEGVPQLLELFDELLARSANDYHEELLAMLEVFVVVQSEEGVERLLTAIQSGLFADSDGWTAVFKACAENEALGKFVCERLSDSLPDGALAVHLLELANRLARIIHRPTPTRSASEDQQRT